MSLLTPFALAGLLLAAPIIAMYILKLRRKETIVSSTFLWRRSLDDVQANAPWQRLRPNMLLLLQLLILVAVVIALAQPAYSRTARYGGDLVVIVDQSYGMQVTDVKPSRFAAAQKQARDLAGSLGTGSVTSVIGMGAQPTLAIAESDDTGAVAHAIDALKPTNRAPNFLAAMSLASSLARGGERTRVVVLTSRESSISSLPLQVRFPVQIVRIGAALHDLGIAAFSAVPDGSRTQAVLRVQNFGLVPARSDLNLTVDGQLADVRPLSLPPGTQQTLFWDDLPARARVLEVQLIAPDDAMADKTAWAVTGASAERRVLLVSGNDVFLQTALSLDPALHLDVIDPNAYRPVNALRYDLVVFDGTLPATLPPVSTLLVAPPPGRVDSLRFGPIETGGTPASVSGLTGSLASLVRYVDLSDVHVARVRRTTLPGWMTPVASAGGRTLLAAGDSGTARYAVIPFALQESDWPLRISFPITVQNLLAYLAPGLTLDHGNITAGTPVHLFLPSGSTNISVSLPGGAVDSLRTPIAAFTDTTAPGLYTVRVQGRRPLTTTFAVNFFPPRTAPATGPAMIWLGGSRAGITHNVTAPVSISWAFGLLALLLLSAEWWFAFRR